MIEKSAGKAFDPCARIDRLRDLDKLKAIEDRELAGYLETLFHANTTRPLKPTRGQLVLPLEVRKVG